jgi:hypothetical protein
MAETTTFKCPPPIDMQGFDGFRVGGLITRASGD